MLGLMLQVLSKTMDSTTLSPEKVELATISLVPGTQQVGADLCLRGLWLTNRRRAHMERDACVLACLAGVPMTSKNICVYIWHLMQVQYKVFEHSQLKPLLDVVNEEQQKEKDKEAGS